VLWCLAVEPPGRPTSSELVSTKDSVRQAVQLKITLEQGFQYPSDPDAGRVEYRPDNLPAGKRRIGRASSARPTSASAFFAGRGGGKQEEAGEEEVDVMDAVGLSPIQGSPNRDAGRASEKTRRARPARPGSARPAASKSPLSTVRPASASARRARGKLAGKEVEPDRPAENYAAWQTASLRQAAKGIESLGLHVADEKDETDLPENLRSTEQAAWERKNMHMLQALPGWQQESVFDAQPEEVALLSVGGKKKKVKSLTKAQKLAAAGAQRRMTKALHAVLAPTLDSRGAMPLEKIEHLLVAQVGMPIAKMLSNAGSKGRACTLVEFIQEHGEDFKMGGNSLVSLRQGDVRAGEKHSVASARILSTILSKDVGQPQP